MYYFIGTVPDKIGFKDKYHNGVIETGLDIQIKPIEKSSH